MIFTGYIEIGDEMAISQEEHIDGFIDALIEGKNYMFMKEKEKK